jgi:sugar lactone lactonase YvrE
MMRKKRSPAIAKITPFLGVPGGELVIDCRGFTPSISSKVFFGEVEASIVTASEDRVVVRMPESPNCLGMTLNNENSMSEVFPFNLATRLASALHPVANPVVARDGTLITTISGSRGQQIARPLVRITPGGAKISFPCKIMNPTGMAFSKDGQLYISSRHDGVVFRYANFERLELFAEDLGIPCGIIFDSAGLLYVGDRTGKIYRIDPSGKKEEFATLEPSVSAYHLAIDSEDRLYVTGPTFSLRDCLYRFSTRGAVETLIRGLARPQGMAFLQDGTLLIAAAFQGRKGIFRYSPENNSLEHFIAAPILVGVAVSGKNLYLATGNSIYHVQLPGQVIVN